MCNAVRFACLFIIMASASAKQQPLEPLTKFRARCIALCIIGSMLLVLFIDGCMAQGKHIEKPLVVSLINHHDFR